MGIYKKLRTPTIKPRTQGGTFYTFPSAMEDIGLNINELKNKVALSHYVLLNIPAFTAKDFGNGVNSGDYTFAEHLENYAFNMETVLRNQPTYNFAESLSVSERVFWKFMQHYGYVSFTKDETTGYYVEDSSCVKAFGQISAGAQRTDEYGIYNETFVQVPSSYGRMKTMFKPTLDKNYYNGGEFYSESTAGFLENNIDEISGGKLPTGISAYAEYDNIGNGYEVASETDALCAVLSLTDLCKCYNETLSYDDLAIKGIGLDAAEKDDPYEFNAILLYYSIYDSAAKNILATNLYGILLLESASETLDGKYAFPIIEKRKTTTTQVGNSYSFRLNIKTSSIYSGDTTVYDNSTAAYEMSTEFNDVIRNLSAAVETLKSNANVIAKISTDNVSIKQLALQCMDRVEDIERDIRLIKSGKTREISANSISANVGAFGAIDASTIVQDTDGNTVGMFDGSVFKYDSAEFGSAVIREIHGNLTTDCIFTDNGGSIDVVDSANDVLATVDGAGIHSKGDVTYANVDSDYKPETAISKDDINTFFNNINVAYEKDSGFMLNLNSNIVGSDIINDILTDTGVSVSGLLAMIIAKLKN